MAALSLVTAPTAEPVSLDEAKTHLRVTGNDEDLLIDALIKAARQHVEGRDGWLNRALITQTWDLFLDCFPKSSELPIVVPLPPLQSITSITYLDGAGASQTWVVTDYTVDAKSEPGRITPAYGKSYPSTRNVMNAVTVRFVAGYGGPVAVPGPLKLALGALVAHFYEHREPIILTGGGGSPVPIPMHVEALLMPYRMWGF